MKNPRPRKYASAAERQAAYRARFVLIEARLDPTTADTLTRLAQDFDIPRAELLVQVIKQGLLSRNWTQLGPRSDLRSGATQQGARAVPKLRSTQAPKNLRDLLLEAPEGAVPMVQEAIRSVAAGNWKQAAKQVGMAAEMSETEDQWFSDAVSIADELWKKG